MIPNGATIGEYHTFNDLKMIARKKITIAPAIPKYNSFNIPGVDGSIDYTEVLTGLDTPPMSNRKGSMDFIVLNGQDYVQAYTNCLAVFNGSRQTMVLDDDPNTEYHGRFSVNKYKSSEKFSRITVDYNIDPPDIE